MGTDNESIPCSLAIPKSLNPRKSSPSSSAKFPLSHQLRSHGGKGGTYSSNISPLSANIMSSSITGAVAYMSALVTRRGTSRVKGELNVQASKTERCENDM